MGVGGDAFSFLPRLVGMLLLLDFLCFVGQIGRGFPTMRVWVRFLSIFERGEVDSVWSVCRCVWSLVVESRHNRVVFVPAGCFQ